jgi:acyl-CoA thioesterase-1
MFVTTLLGLAVSAIALQDGGANRTPRIVVLGDSLTSGHGIGQANAFPSVLQRRLDQAGEAFRVVNAGVAGDTSAGALHRLPSLLTDDVEILIVVLGANDGLRGVPIAQIEANLKRIIERAQARGITVLLCEMAVPPLYGWNYMVAFHRLFGSLAASYGIPLVPFMLKNIIGRADMFQADRLHPNAAGARAVADHVWPHLQRVVSAQKAERFRKSRRSPG